ncbi:uncharacterized protein LOC144115332 isoform X6 [Amblyomma americanum]
MIICNCRGMGSCLSYCCKEQSKRARHVKPAGYFDSSSLIEFETLIDESSSEPKSISSWLNFKKGKLAFHQEDALELEEEAKMQQPDSVEVPPASVGQRVVMRSRLSKEDNWTGADHSAWALAGEEEILNVTRLQCQGHLPSLLAVLSGPQFQAKAWEKERERLNSSPHSSLDLEWENEVGLTPPQQCASAADDDFVYVPGADTCSNHSTPLSNENDLEWDGDLSSVQIGGFDMETEQLISEIEQMTADALKEPSGASR